MARDGLALPVAIAVAGACIGSGLYFGLRARRAPPELASQANIDDAVRAALEQAKPQVKSACWHPSGDSDRDAVTIEIAFDAEGKQVALGVQQPRSSTHPGLGACVQHQLAPLAVPAPGRSAQARLALTFP